MNKILAITLCCIVLAGCGDKATKPGNGPANVTVGERGPNGSCHNCDYLHAHNTGGEIAYEVRVATQCGDNSLTAGCSPSSLAPGAWGTVRAARMVGNCRREVVWIDWH